MFNNNKLIIIFHGEAVTSNSDESQTSIGYLSHFLVRIYLFCTRKHFAHSVFSKNFKCGLSTDIYVRAQFKHVEPKRCVNICSCDGIIKVRLCRVQIYQNSVVSVVNNKFIELVSLQNLFFIRCKNRVTGLQLLVLDFGLK